MAHFNKLFYIFILGLVSKSPSQMEETQEDHKCIPYAWCFTALPWIATIWRQYYKYCHGRGLVWQWYVWRRSLECRRQSYDSRYENAATFIKSFLFIMVWYISLYLSLFLFMNTLLCNILQY